MQILRMIIFNYQVSIGASATAPATTACYATSHAEDLSRT
jgi:hypothetical protein